MNSHYETRFHCVLGLGPKWVILDAVEDWVVQDGYKWNVNSPLSQTLNIPFY